jgi:outer membrane biosynthesis protein TonB
MGLGHGLDEQAVETVKRDWKFKPGSLDGQPIDVEIQVEVSFRL